MPTYSYRCPRCGANASLRRLFSEFDEPAACLACGADMEHVFTPSSNIVIPRHFRAVGPGGTEGGYSWSDFHDVSERELAHVEGVEPYNRAMSRPGAQPVPVPTIGDAYNEVRQMPEGQVRELAATTTGVPE